MSVNIFLSIMNLRTIIERAEAKAGSQIALASAIGVVTSSLRNAKNGYSGIGSYTCFFLADYLNIDVRLVVAASALCREKDPERIEFWKRQIAKYR